MKQHFFHGGVPNLETGGFILPPCETGRDPCADREDRVYVTTDLLQAICCALIAKGMVYLVQPLGRLGPDDNVGNKTNYAARRALILARAWPPPEMAALKYADFHAFHRAVIDLEMALLAQVEPELRAWLELIESHLARRRTELRALRVP
jgi:hypothetical protein